MQHSTGSSITIVLYILYERKNADGHCQKYSRVPLLAFLHLTFLLRDIFATRALSDPFTSLDHSDLVQERDRGYSRSRPSPLTIVRHPRNSAVATDPECQERFIKSADELKIKFRGKLKHHCNQQTSILVETWSSPCRCWDGLRCRGRKRTNGKRDRSSLPASSSFEEEKQTSTY